jgi:hypothetical protein
MVRSARVRGQLDPDAVEVHPSAEVGRHDGKDAGEVVEVADDLAALGAEAVQPEAGIGVAGDDEGRAHGRGAHQSVRK